MTETIREQILAIRDTGLTNMFDLPVVQRLAYERDFYELVLWLAYDRNFFELVTFLEDHRSEYVHFILTGEA